MTLTIGRRELLTALGGAAARRRAVAVVRTIAARGGALHPRGRSGAARPQRDGANDGGRIMTDEP
jgi:hypothetical protein